MNENDKLDPNAYSWSNDDQLSHDDEVEEEKKDPNIMIAKEDSEDEESSFELSPEQQFL
jgi:hypothetical protein